MMKLGINSASSWKHPYKGYNNDAIIQSDDKLENNIYILSKEEIIRTMEICMWAFFDIIFVSLKIDIYEWIKSTFNN